MQKCQTVQPRWKIVNLNNFFFFNMFYSCIRSGSSWLSQGLVRGAEATGKAIHSGATKLREHITPEERPAKVSPRVTTGLRVAQQATGGAVKVSRFLGKCMTGRE